MLIWGLIIIVLFITIIFVFKLFISKDVDSHSVTKSPSNILNYKNPSPVIRKLKAVDVLPNVEAIKEKQEFNWLKLHQNINPANNLEIQTKLTKLIRDEREYIIVDKFIYFTNLNLNSEILQVLEEIEKNSLSYKEILHRSGNK